jgi:hypothetical protein
MVVPGAMLAAVGQFMFMVGIFKKEKEEEKERKDERRKK